MRSRNLLEKGRCVEHFRQRAARRKVLNQDKASSSEEMKKGWRGLRTEIRVGRDLQILSWDCNGKPLKGLSKKATAFTLLKSLLTIIWGIGWMEGKNRGGKFGQKSSFGASDRGWWHVLHWKRWAQKVVAGLVICGMGSAGFDNGMNVGGSIYSDKQIFS